jgi:hypothetical protein
MFRRSTFGLLFLCLFIALAALSAAGILAASAAPLAWQGPIPPIDIGYGQWGEHDVSAAATFTFESQGHDNYLTLYFPADQTAAAPAIFFAPGWNISCQSYGELLRFLASKGYVSVCDDYYEDSGIIGDQLYESFKEAASRYPTQIDVSKFGLAGHSSGAGLLPSVGYRLAVDDGWGVRGKFIFSSAPWIDFDITDAMLAAYPPDMKFILQTYEEDLTTDLRTYIDQFESLDRIPDSEKDYLILRPATIDGYDYHADHPTIATGGDAYGVYDAMDAYGVFRLIDALAAYAFTGDATARAIALEQHYDADRQSEMGDLPDLISTDDPRPIPGLATEYPCDIADNPRREHCDDYDNELPAATPIWPIRHALISLTAPTFTWEPVPTATRYDLQIRPMLPSGEPDWDTSYGVNDIHAADAGCDGGDDCMYTLSSSLPVGDYVWWVRGYDAGGKESVWPRRNFFTRVDDHFYFPNVRARLLNPDDFRFDWEHDGAYERYQVWRATAPYFSPTGEPIKEVAAAPWWFLDLYRAGDPATNYYYVIRGVEAGGATTDKRMGEFDFGLTPGTDVAPDYLSTLVER